MESLTADSHAETLDKVRPLLEEGRHEEALPFFELHKSKSGEPIWSYMLALSLACLTRGEEGLQLLEEVAKAPGFAEHFGIPQETNALLRTTALNHLMFETSVDNSAVEPWIVLYRYAELLNHREFQAKSLVGRMKLDPENGEVVDLFQAMFEDAPPDKVIPILDDIVNTKPNACQPRALLGSFLQQRGKTALAIRHLKTALENDPGAMEPHLYLGKIYLSQARFDDAEKELSAAMSKGKKPTVALLVEVANCQRATYRYEEALNTLFDAFEIHPPTFRHWDQLVDTSQNTGNAAKLVESLRRAADRFPDDARLRQRFAMVAFRQGEPLAARDQLRATGIFENPTKDPTMARLASEVALALGESGTAVHLVEALWKASPNSPETSRLYGDALIADGRAGEAETLLRETAKNNPNDRALQVSWGRSLLALGDAERAHRAFGLASRLDPDDPEAMAEQGRSMLLLGLHEEAQNVLKESAKKVDPPLAVTLTGLGAVYERKGLRDIARDFYRQSLTRNSDRTDAACGMMRTRAVDGSSTLALDVLELCSQLATPFARLKLYLNLLKASFTEGFPKEARTLKDKVYPEVARQLTESYQAFLENSEVRTLTKLAKDLENGGDPEKAREIWRFAVSSSSTELAQKASTELKRLDTYEAPAVTATGDVSEEDPLSSLLSGTIPEDSEESPLFAADTPRASTITASAEADLFADESAPAAADQDAPLFSDAGGSRPIEPSSHDDVLDALFALDTPVARQEPTAAESELFAPQEVIATPPPPSGHDPLFAIADDEVIATPPPTAHISEEIALPPEQDAVDALFALEDPVPEISADDSAAAAEQAEVDALFVLEDPLAESSESPTVQETEHLEAPDDPIGALLASTTPPPPAAEPTPPAASEDILPAITEEALEEPQAIASEPSVNIPLPSSVAVLEPQSDIADPVVVAPVTPVVNAVPDPVPETTAPVPTQVVREELLPIPMAADFSPLTRRQLHYHEALAATSGSGVVNPESLAHLLLQSVVGHEPPDPSSDQGSSSTSLLQSALVASALELENSEQFRGAVRVLRTALLYQPESDPVLSALARVQQRWAHWLAERHEYAHAVSLLRDTLQRQPHNEAAIGQLEAHYQGWMAWSDASGDPAARDLLAVYLEQERQALNGLRQEWEERKARAAAAQAARVAAQTPPPVSAVMPTPAPQPQHQTAATQPAATPAAQPVAPPTPPVATTTPPAEPSRPTEIVEAAAPAPTPAQPAAETAAPVLAAVPPDTTPQASEQPPAVPTPVTAMAASPSQAMFDSKEEALETLDAAPDDESVAEGVFAIYADAMRDLTTILKERANAAPDQPAWLLLLARAFRRSGSETMAVIQYQKYIKVAPSPAAYEELAQTYEELGKEDFAKMTRRKAERT